jgi:hypothetical protein
VIRDRLLWALTALAVLASLGPVEHSASTSGRTFLVGVAEDGPRWGRSRPVKVLGRALGLKAVRITVPWTAGESRLSQGERDILDEAVAGLRPLRVVAAVYGDADDAPQDEAGREAFCSFAADLVARYRAMGDVVVWNEPNSARFWRPQRALDGASVAPAAYEALLATCWSKLHAVRPGVNVIAASAPRGGEPPQDGIDASHPPGIWYRKLGAAYRASGRGQPIFDTVGHNPYPDFTSERPWTRHTTSQSIALGDYKKLTSSLRAAFRGTGQPLPGQGRVRIWYMEQGFQTTIDPGKEHLYRGVESDRFALPPWSSRAGTREGLAPDQATQLVDSIRLAYCQREVGAYFNFLLADEPELEGWQSGVLWADWTTKPSYAALAQVVREVNAGRVDCGSLAKAAAPASPEEPASMEISGVRVRASSPFSATVSWRTSLPSETRLGYGVRGSAATIWHVSEGTRTEHAATLSGLLYSTPYRIWVSALGPEGQQAQATVDLTTPALPALVRPSVARGAGALLLDGEPYFPFMVWGQCSDEYRGSLAVGISLFAENACGDLQEQMDALGGRALSAGVAGRPGASGPGLIGYFHPDEADGLGLTAETLPEPPAGAEDGVRFLTLTNHFYSGVTPLAWGRDMYPGLIAASDVVGFDLYPLQELCRPERLADVYLAQVELVRLAAGKPTFQWIEAADWRCPGGSTAVTPATVRAEAWLAIAGGARGLGFFPADWTPAVGQAIARLARQVAGLGPALFSFPVPATAGGAGGQIVVGARAHEGALYVIAVNPSRVATEATIRVPGLEGRRLSVLDEERSLVPEGNAFSDAFPPLAVHVYVAAPQGA